MVLLHSQITVNHSSSRRRCRAPHNAVTGGLPALLAMVTELWVAMQLWQTGSCLARLCHFAFDAIKESVVEDFKSGLYCNVPLSALGPSTVQYGTPPGFETLPTTLLWLGDVFGLMRPHTVLYMCTLQG